MTKMSKFSTYFAGAALVASFAIPAATNAQSPKHATSFPKPAMHMAKSSMMNRSHGVAGTVSAISGTSLTLTSAKSSSTTYTVDASSATLVGGMMNGTLPLSDIQVGDKLIVKGTINGTNIAATSIMDPSLMGRVIFQGRVTAVSGSTITITGMKGTTSTIDANSATITKGFGKNATSTSVSSIQVGDHLTAIGTLNGSTVTATSIVDLSLPKNMMHMEKPAVAGKVTAISGSTITITGMKGTTSTIDASSATITKGFGKNAASSTLSAITVGDIITAQGTVNGSTVTATSIADLGTITFPQGHMMVGKKH